MANRVDPSIAGFNGRGLMHVPEKHALGLDPRVESGSPGRTVVRRQGHASTVESTAFPLDLGSLSDPRSRENAVAREQGTAQVLSFIISVSFVH
jgi:hypothetical protein